MRLTLSAEAAERLGALLGRLRAADPEIVLRLRKFGGCRGGGVWLGPAHGAPGDRPVDCVPALPAPVVADPYSAGLVRRVRAVMDERGLRLVVEDAACALPQPVSGPDAGPARGT